MALQIIKKSDQAYGSFNNGDIFENKPIGFPQDEGKTKPYSNLFYWAHASAKINSTIGLHPHRGFEIVSYVLKGTIRHYDTKTDKWWDLNQGDLQVIKSGSGLSHSEELKKNSVIFQIWFDPNMTKSLYQEPDYKDYKSDCFPTNNKQNLSLKTIVGKNSPVNLDSEGIEMEEISILENTEWSVDLNKIYSIYILDGKGMLNNKQIGVDDFITVNELEKLSFKVKEPLKIFAITSPKNPSYKSYYNS